MDIDAQGSIADRRVTGFFNSLPGPREQHPSALRRPVNGGVGSCQLPEIEIMPRHT